VRAPFEAGGGLMPLNLRIEQAEDDREITAVESGVSTPECLDVRLAHLTAIHHAGSESDGGA